MISRLGRPSSWISGLLHDSKKREFVGHGRSWKTYRDVLHEPCLGRKVFQTFKLTSRRSPVKFWDFPSRKHLLGQLLTDSRTCDEDKNETRQQVCHNVLTQGQLLFNNWLKAERFGIAWLVDQNYIHNKNMAL